MNLFERSATFLVGQLSQVAGRRCLYVRVEGSEQWEMTIPVSQRQYEILDDDSVLTMVTVFDWIIPASALSVTPRKGDEIRDLDAGKTYTVAPIKPRPACEGFDSQGATYLVHSKLTGVDDV